MWYYDFFCWFGIHLGRKWTHTNTYNLIEYGGEIPYGRRYIYSATCPHCNYVKFKKKDVK